MASLSINHSEKHWLLFSSFPNLVNMAKIGVLVSVTYESIEDLKFRIIPFTWVPIPSIFMTSFVSTQNQSCSEETMAPLSRFEISGPELVEADEKVPILFEKIG